MDSILVVWLLPELLPVLFLLILLVMWLGEGNLARVLPHARPRGDRVPSTYWGGYEAVSKLAEGEIVLPVISPLREPVKWEKDWTGG